MDEFRNNDDEYLRWVEQHPNGYVVNTYKRPHKNYLILHRGSCRQIQTPKRTNYTNSEYMKVCSPDRSELESWASMKTGGELRPCTICDPR